MRIKIMKNIRIRYDHKLLVVSIDDKTRATEIVQIAAKVFNFKNSRITLMYKDRELQSKELLVDVIKDNVPIDIKVAAEEEKPSETLTPFNFLEKEMGKNNELRQIMQSDNFMEEMGKLSTDSNYMTQQAKNADIAMSRLENFPGGLNMMSSMVNDVSSPLSNLLDSGKNVKDLKGENIVCAQKEPIKTQTSTTPNYLLIYRKELIQLSKYGFTDIKKNISALKQADGDLIETIELLTQENL